MMMRMTSSTCVRLLLLLMAWTAQDVHGRLRYSSIGPLTFDDPYARKAPERNIENNDFKIQSDDSYGRSPPSSANVQQQINNMNDDNQENIIIQSTTNTVEQTSTTTTTANTEETPLAVMNQQQQSQTDAIISRLRQSYQAENSNNGNDQENVVLDQQLLDLTNVLAMSWASESDSVSNAINYATSIPTTPQPAVDIYNYGLHTAATTTLHLKFVGRVRMFQIPKGTAIVQQQENEKLVIAYTTETVRMSSSMTTIKVRYELPIWDDDGCFPTMSPDNCFKEDGSVKIVAQDSPLDVPYTMSFDDHSVEIHSIKKTALHLEEDAFVWRNHNEKTSFVADMSMYQASLGSMFMSDMFERIMESPRHVMVEPHFGQQMDDILRNIPLDTMPAPAKFVAMHNIAVLFLQRASILRDVNKALRLCNEISEMDNAVDKISSTEQMLRLWESAETNFIGSLVIDKEQENDASSMFKMIDQEAQSWSTTMDIISSDGNVPMTIASANFNTLSHFLNGRDALEQNNCALVREYDAQISNEMKTVILQGALRSFYQLIHHTGSHTTVTDRIKAEALVYAIAIIPILEQIDNRIINVDIFKNIVQLFDIKSIAREADGSVILTYKSIEDLDLDIDKMETEIAKALAALQLDCMGVTGTEHCSFGEVDEINLVH